MRLNQFIFAVFFLITPFKAAAQTLVTTDIIEDPVKVRDVMSRWHFGFHAGYKNNSMDLSSVNPKLYPNQGGISTFTVGAFVQYGIDTDRHLNIRPEVVFSQLGGKIWGDNQEDVIPHSIGLKNSRWNERINYLDIRIPFLYSFLEPWQDFRPFVYAGPIISLACGGNTYLHEEFLDGSSQDYHSKINTSNTSPLLFAGTVGAGIQYQFPVQENNWFVSAEINYVHTFTNNLGSNIKNGKITIVNSTEESKQDGNRRYNGFEIKVSLGIPFDAFRKKTRNKTVLKNYYHYQTDTVYIQKEVIKEVQVPVKQPTTFIADCYTLDQIIRMIDRGEDVRGKKICSITDIQFEFNKSEIKSSSFSYLDKLAEAMIRTGWSLEISGHTDKIGTSSYNQILSKNRAKAVYEYLLKKGVNRRKLTYTYHGFDQPLTTNNTPEGRRINRRVEFIILSN